MKAAILLLLLGVLVLSGCASSKISVSSVPTGAAVKVDRIAIAPGSGVFGDAIAVELFNLGFTVVDSSETSRIAARVGLQEIEVTSDEGYAALREAGIEAVLSARAVSGTDGTPESASVRITSLKTGEIIAGVSWQNGWGGQRGSVADRTMRKNLSQAAREIAQEISKRLGR